MLHDETRKLLIEAWNKTHNAKEIAECFSVNTSTVYRLEKQMCETGSVKTRTSQRGRKHALTPEDIQNIDRVVRQEPDITIDEIIDTLGIRTKLEDLPSALSGGQQQRVAIARALAAKPAILLADEPTGNLDSKTSQDVLGLLKVTSKRFHQTIVMITHNEEIAQMADRILQIEDGKIVSDSGLV